MSQFEATEMSKIAQTLPPPTCPLCLSPTSELIFRVNAEQATSHFLHPKRDGVRYQRLMEKIEALWSSHQCAVFKCGVCGSGYAWPHVGGDGTFYSLAYDRKRGSYPATKWEFEEALRRADLDTSNHRILEYGAGDGAFVRLLLGAGVKGSHVTVCEFDEYGRSVIRSLDEGIVVLSGEDLQALVNRRPKFNAVFLFQCLEHLSNLDGYVQTFSSLLANDGLLCFAVPNPHRTEFQESHGMLLDMPPNHLTRFSVKGITAIAERNGFSVVWVGDEPPTVTSDVLQLCTYAFLRKSQKVGTFPHWVNGLNGPFRTIFAAIYIALFVPKIAAAFAMSGNPGGARLALLRKRV